MRAKLWTLIRRWFVAALVISSIVLWFERKGELRETVSTGANYNDTIEKLGAVPFRFFENVVVFGVAPDVEPNSILCQLGKSIGLKREAFVHHLRLWPDETTFRLKRIGEIKLFRDGASLLAASKIRNEMSGRSATAVFPDRSNLPTFYFLSPSVASLRCELGLKTSKDFFWTVEDNRYLADKDESALRSLQFVSRGSPQIMSRTPQQKCRSRQHDGKEGRNDGRNSLNSVVMDAREAPDYEEDGRIIVFGALSAFTIGIGLLLCVVRTISRR